MGYDKHSLEENAGTSRGSRQFLARHVMCGDPVEEEGCQTTLEEESTAGEEVGDSLSLVLPSVPG